MKEKQEKVSVRGGTDSHAENINESSGDTSSTEAETLALPSNFYRCVDLQPLGFNCDVPCAGFSPPE